MNVCVMWKEGDSWREADPTVFVLTYGDGSARVHDRSRVDARVGDAHFVRTLEAACDILARNDGTKLLVPIRIARQIVPGTIFAEAV